MRNIAACSAFFKKTKLNVLKSIHFHFETPTKQTLVFFFEESFDAKDFSGLLLLVLMFSDDEFNRCSFLKSLFEAIMKSLYNTDLG